jgi:hypothetical protein
MAGGQPTPDGAGFVEVITGGGGEGLQSMLEQSQWPTWVAAGALRFHFTEVSVEGTTMTVRSIATDGNLPAVIDTFTLTRSP